MAGPVYHIGISGDLWSRPDLMMYGTDYSVYPFVQYTAPVADLRKGASLSYNLAPILYTLRYPRSLNVADIKSDQYLVSALV